MQHDTTFHTRADYLLPCSRVIREKLMVPRLVEKFQAFYGIRKINVFQVPATGSCLEPVIPVHNFAPSFFKVHFNIVLYLR
jgi:hypothetical protein